MDGCDGYAASLRRITQGWVDANVRNALVAGDVHRNWANDVKADYRDSASRGRLRTGLHIHYLHRHRHRHRLHGGSGDGLEPAPELKR